MECSVSDLCRITGVSERTLQYAFSDHFGISPNRYLREVRLNTVHKALARASFGDVKVTDIANNYGFWHMPVCRRFQTPVQKVTIRGAEKNIQSVFIITFKQLPVKCVYTAQRIKKTTKKEYPECVRYGCIAHISLIRCGQLIQDTPINTIFRLLIFSHSTHPDHP